MRIKVFMAFMAAFVLLTAASWIAEGIWGDTQHSNAIGWLTSYETYASGQGAVSFNIWQFLTEGIPALFSWDYEFLNNLGQGGLIVRWILGVIVSGGFVYELFVMTLPIIGNIISRAFGGLFSLFRPY